MWPNKNWWRDLAFVGICILTGSLAKPVFDLILIGVVVAGPLYFLYRLWKRTLYFRKRILHILIKWRMEKEFAKPASPFYGWKYELLFPARYMPWTEVIKMHVLSRNNWIPKGELKFTEAVLSDRDMDHFHWFEENVGCHHDQFITLKVRRYKKFAEIPYSEEGLLHVCLQCQQQIGYVGIGLN